MTRINTNVSSLIAQTNLARSHDQLQTALTRLSTGLRINSGKDDPAGLIASQVLQSDITSTQGAITNSQRADQLISTADSALGQVSTLLNSIQALVTQSANTGALSASQLQANQLQIDSSLEAIDRIAQTTSFQGQKLLDGNLDFITTGVDTSKIQGLQINQANFGTQTAIGAQVNVIKQASQGSLNYKLGALGSDATLQVSGKNGSNVFQFAAGSSIANIASAVNLVSDATGVQATVQKAATKGALDISSFGTNNDITLTANTAGQAAGNLQVKYSLGGTSSTTAVYTAGVGNDPGTIDVQLQTEASVAATALADPAGANNSIDFTALQAGSDYNGVTVKYVAGGTAGSELYSYDDSTKILSIQIDTGVSTALQIKNALGSAANAHAAALFSAVLHPDNDGSGTVAAVASAGTFGGGVDGGGVVATASDVVTAINGVSGIPVTASLSGTDNGLGLATAFDKFASSGSVASSNALQFLGTSTAANIRYTSVAGQSLGVDTTTAPRVLGNSATTIQEATANSTLTFTAQAKGTAADGVTVSYVDDANVTVGNEFAVYDKNAQTLTIHIDDTNTTAADVLAAVNNDNYVKQYFHASNFGNSTGAGVVAAGDSGITAGGLVSSGTLIVKLATDSNGIVTTTANDLVNFFNDSANAAALSPYEISVSNGIGSSGTGKLAATTSDLTFQGNGTTDADALATTTTNAVNGVNAQVAITATTPGAAYNGVKVIFENDNTLTGGGDETGVYDATSKTLTVNIAAGTTTAADIETLITGDATLSQLFTADASGTGLGKIDISDTGTLAGGVTTSGNQQGAALLGNSDLAETGLTFTSTTYGSDSFVSVKALSGTFQLTDSTGAASDRSTGTDVEALVNGVRAIGQGLTARLATSALDLSFTIASTVASGSNFDFSITGGGAKFQLGPKVVSNQQARLGISGVSSATLGGTAGKLFELHSGGDKSLTNNVGGAAAVLTQVIDVITSLRGRLGAFQSTTLETNINTLKDTLTNLTTAQSSIQDADFAAESANLTRAQILVQSGTSVLQLSNQAPQQVLALLPRG